MEESEKNSNNEIDSINPKLRILIPIPPRKINQYFSYISTPIIEEIIPARNKPKHYLINRCKKKENETRKKLRIYIKNNV